MCLAVPGRIAAIYQDGPMRMATLDFDGITKAVCLAYLPDAVVGQYAIVHVGFAISLIDEASAQETLRHFRSLGILEEELGEAADEAYAPPPPCPLPAAVPQ
ncbi:MAG: HypC/HybG/HupF family hydrogenase formation chaperone [Gemmatimonadaceae bacterium]|jgi:hydrogenase expression/formation protein HypC|uniref:HypC/HybG/HupF family hydrogenase formation chaperone n=1 Tax=Gemmatimonas sp. UBA7669 TaxID=1946568 RepID=UPI0025BECEDE|nr:HypC/HybG/HupF family hydrogenase formation chaperone [Gemmatimonas sp. UBA7669]MBA3917231.1 HypC/HybG/HupF family hydrogenase formation chaperone [Gemmatimonas sp.]MBL0889568.1 HypC/HybG/HupF family hydrogenase formation chaperone [Gemmatimonadaceae bacterium]MBX9855368.1 HypC/HybG/HupF family hydrogenase formation chaperone [Gemmatimonadaceae bacterium]